MEFSAASFSIMNAEALLLSSVARIGAEQSVTAIVPAQVVNSRSLGTCTDEARLRQIVGSVIVLPTISASHSCKVEQ